jgi:hypothetical protein
MWLVPSRVAVDAEGMQLTSELRIEASGNESSDAQFEALSRGEVDAVVTAMDNVMDWNLRERAADFRIIAQTEQTTPLTLIAQRDVSSFGDLRGANILVDAPGNGLMVALRAMFAEEGIGRDAFRLTGSGGVKERTNAIIAGRGDATLLGPPFDVLALQAGLVALARIQDRYPTFPGQGVVTRRQTLSRLRPQLSQWLRCVDVARQRIKTHIGGARKVLLGAGFPAPAVEAMLTATPRSLRPSEAGIGLLIGQRQRLGLPGANLSYADLVDVSAVPRD